MKPVQGVIFIISGPSGSGKTTLLKHLLKAKGLKNCLIKSTSFTTRPKRPNEQGGQDYFFISEKEFKRQLKAKKILEWTKYLGYYYATPRELVARHLKEGNHIILCLDLKGALRVKRLYPHNTVTIFILPPSLKTLWERIRGRSQKTKEQEIDKRMRLATKELLAAPRYDYCLVNKDLVKAVTELQDFILNKINT